jgi:purine-binding chemotaxis protein CheW
VLLIDDSEAVLAYERAALAGHYTIGVAADGIAGLAEMRAAPPAVVVLDLSMPRMDGDEVLEIMLADPELREIPVVVVSSEESRGHACVRAGALEFLPKPVSAAELLAAVNRAYDAAAERRARQDICALLVEAGGVEFGMPVACVESVMLQTATEAGPNGEALVRMQARSVPLVDLPERFGVPHWLPEVDRKLIVVVSDTATVAFCVDDVHGPEDIAGSEITSEPEALGVARTSRGPRVIVDASTLHDPGALARLPALARTASRDSMPQPPPISTRRPNSDAEALRAQAVLGVRAQRASLVTSRTDEEPTWVAQVQVGTGAFAIPLTMLLGVVPSGGLVPVPLSPPHVLGLVRFRGELIAALSSAWLAGLPEQRRDRTALLVTETFSGRRFAMDCERVPEPVAMRRGPGSSTPLKLLDLDRALARL